MSDRFIKFIPSNEAMYLLKNRGHAFRLLSIIAESARRYEGGPDGLRIGEAFIGGHEKYDMTEQNYRTAKKILVELGHISIIETNRTRKSLTEPYGFPNRKVTTGVTTEGTKVKILSSNVWDINLEEGNDRPNDRLTTDQRLPNDKLRKTRKIRKKEEHIADCSFSEKIKFRENVSLKQTEFDALVAKDGKDFVDVMLDILDSWKGSSGKEYKQDYYTMKQGGWVRNKAVEYMRKPKFLQEDKSKENELFSKGLEKKYENYVKGWRCRIYHDNKKDQKGILFESSSGYVQTYFVAFSDGSFEDKVSNFLRTNKLN